MNRALVRWESGTWGLVPVREARSIMDRALGRSRESNAIEANLPRASYSLQTRDELIDLPRICTVHDRPYIARYIRNESGRFRLAQTFRVTESICEQYAAIASDRRTMSGKDCQEESCPWCGAHGFGSIYCYTCRAEVCYGRTDARRYFRCRLSCGNQCQLTASDRTMEGLEPYLRPVSPPQAGRR
jgi:hypothetical protein